MYFQYFEGIINPQMLLAVFGAYVSSAPVFVVVKCNAKQVLY